MIVTLKTHRLRTVPRVRAFLDGTAELDVQVVEPPHPGATVNPLVSDASQREGGKP